MYMNETNASAPEELTEINGAEWLRDADGGLMLKVKATLPLHTPGAGLTLRETDVIVAVYDEDGATAFMMISPDPCSVFLPNWSQDGRFICTKLHAMREDPDCSLDSLAALAAGSLQMQPDCTFIEEAVNRNAAAWYLANIPADAQPDLQSAHQPAPEPSRQPVPDPSPDPGTAPEGDDVIVLRKRDRRPSPEPVISLRRRRPIPPQPSIPARDTESIAPTSRNTIRVLSAEPVSPYAIVAPMSRTDDAAGSPQ